MKKDEMKRLARNPKHISGIYNYCDRWCERCAFTSRCLNFVMSEEKFSDPETRDLNNAAFWEKLSETFKETMLMLHEMAAEKGIDLNDIEIDEEAEKRREEREKAVVHMIAHMARSYADSVDEWFDVNVTPYQKDAKALRLVSDEDPIDAESQTDTLSAIDAIEVIRWYQFQIYVKLKRAIDSARSEEVENEFWDEFPKDSEGSAKVALIGIDRSISAWGNMVDLFPGRDEKILHIIADLKRLRNRIEKVFPKARAFVRPGFDEVSSEN
jgi:hypothetical protein